jgi:hypothetical protein
MLCCLLGIEPDSSIINSIAQSQHRLPQNCTCVCVTLSVLCGGRVQGARSECLNVTGGKEGNWRKVHVEELHNVFLNGY